MHWTEKEKDFLKENYNNFTRNELATQLNRTLDGIGKMAKKLQLSNIHLPTSHPGEKFGRLTLVKMGPPKHKGTTFWYCNCDCGTKNVLVGQTHLRRKATVSCGCFQKERTTKEAGWASWTYLYRGCKNGAIVRNLSFELSINDYIEIASKECIYCGENPTVFNAYLKADMITVRSPSAESMSEEGIARSTINRNGVDRVDSNKGYLVRNCVPCCEYCNFLKNKLTLNNFYQHLEKIIERKLFVLNTVGGSDHV